MDKIGISFRSELSDKEVRRLYIGPLRAQLEEQKAGIYVNYLRQVDPDEIEPTEHLLVFEVHDFKKGLRVLRLELEQLGMPEGTQLQNLNPSSPGY